MTIAGKQSAWRQGSATWLGRGLHGALLTAILAAPGLARADNPVALWNAKIVEVTRLTSSLLIAGPPDGARKIAMTDTAVFNAINAATGMQFKAYNSTVTTVADASAEAAGLEAGYRVLKSLYSAAQWQGSNVTDIPAGAAQQAAIASQLAAANQVIDDAYLAALGSLQASGVAADALAKGQALGLQEADNIISLRSNDLSYEAIVDGLTPAVAPGAGTVPGAYIGPTSRPAMFPMWGTVTPFTTDSATLKGYELALAPGNVDVSTAAYAKSIALTQCIGGTPASAAPGGVVSTTTEAACDLAFDRPTDSLQGGVQTAAQRESALFWNDPGGSMHPPGHWLTITADVIGRLNGDAETGNDLDLVEQARLYALVGIALADGGIAGWDVKYRENLWRPITAIRECGTSAINSNSFEAVNETYRLSGACDPTWQSVISTPPHPDYVAGHPTFSGGAAEVLRTVVGRDDFTFCSTSDAYTQSVGDADFANIPEITLCYDSFSSAIEDAELSRIWGGIHTDIAVVDANLLGLRIGQNAVFNNLQPVPEPASMALLLAGAGGIGLARARRRG